MIFLSYSLHFQQQWLSFSFLQHPFVGWYPLSQLRDYIECFTSLPSSVCCVLLCTVVRSSTLEKLVFWVSRFISQMPPGPSLSDFLSFFCLLHIVVCSTTRKSPLERLVFGVSFHSLFVDMSIWHQDTNACVSCLLSPKIFHLHACIVFRVSLLFNSVFSSCNKWDIDNIYALAYGALELLENESFVKGLVPYLNV